MIHIQDTFYALIHSHYLLIIVKEKCGVMRDIEKLLLRLK